MLGREPTKNRKKKKKKKKTKEQRERKKRTKKIIGKTRVATVFFSCNYLICQAGN